MLRYIVIAVIAFTIGSATVAAAGPAISGFVGLVDGNNTAAINTNRELSVTDSGSAAALQAANTHLANIDSAEGRFAFDGGALRTAPQGTQTVSGVVNVASMPALTIAGTPTVTVANLPATQQVTGTVNIGGTIATRETLPANAIDVAAFLSPQFVITNISQIRPPGTRFAISSVTFANTGTGDIGIAQVQAYFFFNNESCHNGGQVLPGGVVSGGPTAHVGAGQTVSITFPQPFVTQINGGLGTGVCLQATVALAQAGSQLSVLVVGYEIPAQ